MKRKEITVFRTGQQGVILSDGNLKIGIDLFLSPAEGRKIDNILSKASIESLDLIMGTHDHEDHIDRNAWKRIAQLNKKVQFVVPFYFRNTIPKELRIEKERFIFCKEEEFFAFKQTKFTAIPAAHELLLFDEEGNSPALIYILDLNGVRICHMGDTCLYEGLLRRIRHFSPIDIVFIPINGRDAVRYRNGCLGNMTYQEAADFCGCINPKIVVPGHYDMFSFNGEDPQLFKEYLAVKYPGCNCKIIPAGDQIVFEKK